MAQRDQFYNPAHQLRFMAENPGMSQRFGGQQASYGQGWGGGGPVQGSSPFLDQVPGMGQAYAQQGGAAPGGAPMSGPVGPGQLEGLLTSNPSENEMIMHRGRQMQFQELERAPDLFGGDYAQSVGGAIQRQMSGQDAPYTPQVQDMLRAQGGDAMSAANRFQQQGIGDRAAASGLHGGGGESSMRAQALGGMQRNLANQNRQLGVTSAMENFASRERGRGAGMDWINMQADVLGRAGQGKSNVLDQFGITGQGGAGAGGVPSGFVNAGFDGSNGSVGYGGGMGAQFKTDPNGYMQGGGMGNNGMQYSQDHQTKVSEQRAREEAERQRQRQVQAQAGQGGYAQQGWTAGQAQQYDPNNPYGFIGGPAGGQANAPSGGMSGGDPWSPYQDWT